MKKLLTISAIALVAFCGAAQTTSQVQGNFNEAIQFTLTAPNAVSGVTSSSTLSLPAFITGALSYGTNGVGIGRANQLYAAQFAITNGALVGTNWLNLYSMTMNGVSPNDGVGNAFVLKNIKMIAFQNLGTNTSASASEANLVDVILPTGAIGWTNQYGHAFSSCSIPSPSGTPSAANTPAITFWAPGDVGWLVGTTASNTIAFTNPIASTTSYLNVYVIGSTNQ